MHYTLRDVHRFGADYLMEKGYDVELWCVYEKKNLIKEFVCTSGHYEEKNYYEIEEKEFASKLEKNKDAVYLCYFEPNSNFMYYLFKSKNKYLMFGGLGLVYVKEVEEKKREGILSRYYNLIKENGSAAFFKYIRNILIQIAKEKRYKILLEKNPPQKIIMATGQGITTLPVIYRDKKYEFIHAQDYDRYLELKEEKEEEKHIVYVDSGYGFMDFDSSYLGLSNPFKGHEDEYFQQLENLFILLEEYYKLPVLIAGHPYVGYNENAFSGRKIYYNQTAELIKKSKLVVMSMGTSINFVLLFKKKVMGITSEIFEKLYNWNFYLEPNYRIFNITPYDLANTKRKEDIEKYITTISDKTRNNYIKKYIKDANSDERTIIEVVEDILLQIN